MKHRLIWGALLLIIYLVTSVPVGLFLYSLKSAWGYNVFKGNAGFHAYMQCVHEQLQTIQKEHTTTP